MAEITPFGAFFEKLRDKSKMFLWIMYAILAILVGLNFLKTPEHPHFGWDAYPTAFAWFGVLVGVGMVIVMKKIVQPFISRDEEFYDRGD